MISANEALPGSYDYSEVTRSVFIAIAASYAALDLAGRVTAARGWARPTWLSGGAIVMGMRGRTALGGRAGCSSCWWTEPTIQPSPPRWLGAERDIPSGCLFHNEANRMIRSEISTHPDVTKFPC